MKDIFISYSHGDSSFVDELCIEFDNKGIDYWRDKEEITATKNIVLSINDGLIKSKFGLVILSSNYFNPGWTTKELTALITQEANGEKEIIYVLQNCTYSDVQKQFPLISSAFIIDGSVGPSKVAGEIFRIISMKNKNIHSGNYQTDSSIIETYAVIDKNRGTLKIGNIEDDFYYVTSVKGEIYLTIDLFAKIIHISKDNIVYSQVDDALIIFHGDMVIYSKVNENIITANGVFIPFNHRAVLNYEDRYHLSLSVFSTLLACRLIENESLINIVRVKRKLVWNTEYLDTLPPLVKATLLENTSR